MKSDFSDVWHFRAKVGRKFFFGQVGERALRMQTQEFCYQQLPAQMVFLVESAVAVLFVSRYGMSDVCHMGADLVGLAGMQRDLHQRIFSVRFLDAVIGANAGSTRSRL